VWTNRRQASRRADRSGRARSRDVEYRDRYNIERSQSCAKGLFTEITCTPAYEPVWIAEPQNAEPTLEEIQTRSDAVGVEVQRFWDAVCEDARTRATTDDERQLACPME
jgi:hypothetical protein